jgi:hypothetical protein
VISESHSATLNRNKTHLRWCAAAVGVTFLLLLWLCRSLIAGYFPTADELALEVASTTLGGPVHPASWFTQGFHFYFQIYPEWQVAQTDFWRPLANALFWLHYQLFGTHWGTQLIIGYLTHAMMVGLTGYIALWTFRLNRWLALLAMLIAALNPAFWSANGTYNELSNNSPPELVQFPIFQTEILCALLMMGAFLAFSSSRYVLFCIFATVALLLKETALTVPVAAIALVGAWRRPSINQTLRNFALLVLPLVIWYFGRTFLFDYGKSLYVLSAGSHWGMLLKPIRHVFYLPTLLYRGPLAVTKTAILTREPRTLLVHGLELATNTAWWLAVFYALLRVARSVARRWPMQIPEPWISGLVFAMGNLCLVMLLQIADPRFAYFWFALGPAALFAALSHTRHPVGFATALGLSLALPQVFAVNRALSADSILNYDLSKRSGVALTQLLGKLPASVSTVFLVDDVVLIGTASQYLARFAGFHGTLVVINTVVPILGCRSAKAETPRYQIRRTGSTTQLDYTAPDCFYQLNQAPIHQIDDQQQVKRGPWMIYRYPEMTVGAVPGSVIVSDYDSGDHWTVTSTNPSCIPLGACVWLGLDISRQAYYALN